MAVVDDGKKDKGLIQEHKMTLNVYWFFKNGSFRQELRTWKRTLPFGDTQMSQKGIPLV